MRFIGVLSTSKSVTVALGVVGCCLILGGWPSVAPAQSGGAYKVTWSTVDGGGGESSGGIYQVTGTAGQPDAGVQAGGTYALESGFWSTATTHAVPAASLLALFAALFFTAQTSRRRLMRSA